MPTTESNHLNTVDEALRLADVLMRDLADKESKSYQSYQIFAALAGDEGEGLVAFLIWRVRGETITELTGYPRA